MKLIRSSVATLARRRLGEEHFVQVERMLGHSRAPTSDLYALFEPGFLGRALAVTESIMDDIEKLAPGAFHRNSTGQDIPAEPNAARITRIHQRVRWRPTLDKHNEYVSPFVLL